MNGEGREGDFVRRKGRRGKEEKEEGKEIK